MKAILNDYRKLTKEFEGLRLKPYRCSAGKLTIGYGRNLDDVGIDQYEAELMFTTDFNKAAEDAQRLLTKNGVDFKDLSECRFFVLTDMMFNLGYNKLSMFKKLLQALKNHDYDAAAREMKDSKWYRDVGDRAKKLVNMMKNNS